MFELSELLSHTNDQLMEFLGKHHSESEINQLELEKIELKYEPPFYGKYELDTFSFDHLAKKHKYTVEELTDQLVLYDQEQKYLESAEAEIKNCAEHAIENPILIEISRDLCELHNLVKEKHDKDYEKKLSLVKRVLYKSNNNNISDSPLELPEFDE